MTTIRFGLQQLFIKRREVDIINDERFRRSKEAFKAVLVNLKQEGKGDSKHKEVISDEDMENLYASDALSVSSPKTLQNKVFLDYMLHFCNRGRENLHTLRKDDFVDNVDAAGRKYFTMGTKLTKNRREEDDDVSGANRMYEDKGTVRVNIVYILFNFISIRNVRLRVIITNNFFTTQVQLIKVSGSNVK
jgi:hypothetical protein